MTQLRRWKIAAVIERPIPFYVPHYRNLAQQADIDLTVVYLSDAGLRPFLYHGVKIQHSAELLEGYPSVILGRGSATSGVQSPRQRYLPELWRVLSRGGYDAIWVHGYNMLGHWSAFAFGSIWGVPTMLRGESESMLHRSVSKRLLKQIVLRPLFWQVSAFLCIGAMNRQFYLEHGVPQRKLHAMPYGVDNEWFAGNGEVEREQWRISVRRRLGIGEDTLVFVNHSKHRTPKRPEDVVRAFGRLASTCDVALVLAGDGDRRGEVDAACAEIGHGRPVIRLGCIDAEELRQVLAASDVLAFASEENWGMAVNEGLAAGLAILCSDRVAGVIDMVEEGVNGFIFKSADVTDLAAKMDRLASDPQLVASMRIASARIASRFDFHAMNEGLRSSLRAISP
jgi:glycosyltransferase involved in cell wall biosynthesis